MDADAPHQNNEGDTAPPAKGPLPLLHMAAFLPLLLWLVLATVGLPRDGGVWIVAVSALGSVFLASLATRAARRAGGRRAATWTLGACVLLGQLPGCVLLGLVLLSGGASVDALIMGYREDVLWASLSFTSVLAALCLGRARGWPLDLRALAACAAGLLAATTSENNSFAAMPLSFGLAGVAYAWHLLEARWEPPLEPPPSPTLPRDPALGTLGSASRVVALSTLSALLLYAIAKWVLDPGWGFRDGLGIPLALGLTHLSMLVVWFAAQTLHARFGSRPPLIVGVAVAAFGAQLFAVIQARYIEQVWVEGQGVLDAVKALLDPSISGAVLGHAPVVGLITATTLVLRLRGQRLAWQLTASALLAGGCYALSGGGSVWRYTLGNLHEFAQFGLVSGLLIPVLAAAVDRWTDEPADA